MVMEIEEGGLCDRALNEISNVIAKQTNGSDCQFESGRLGFD